MVPASPGNIYCANLPRNLTHRTHVSRTPKTEYLITRSQLTERGPLERSRSIFDGNQVCLEKAGELARLFSSLFIFHGNLRGPPPMLPIPRNKALIRPY